MVLYSYYNCTSTYLFNYIVHCKYPLFLEILLNMIKYWVRLSKINTSSTLLSECLLLSEALHKQNKNDLFAYGIVFLLQLYQYLFI
jgi:hypothetical protein